MMIIESTKSINDPFAVNNKPMKNSWGASLNVGWDIFVFLYKCIFVHFCLELAVTNKLIKNSGSEVSGLEPQCRLKNCICILYLYFCMYFLYTFDWGYQQADQKFWERSEGA